MGWDPNILGMVDYRYWFATKMSPKVLLHSGMGLQRCKRIMRTVKSSMDSPSDWATI